MAKKTKKSGTLVAIYSEWMIENNDGFNPYRVFMSDGGGDWSQSSSL